MYTYIFYFSPSRLHSLTNSFVVILLQRSALNVAQEYWYRAYWSCSPIRQWHEPLPWKAANLSVDQLHCAFCAAPKHHTHTHIHMYIYIRVCMSMHITDCRRVWRWAIGIALDWIGMFFSCFIWFIAYTYVYSSSCCCYFIWLLFFAVGCHLNSGLPELFCFYLCHFL